MFTGCKDSCSVKWSIHFFDSSFLCTVDDDDGDDKVPKRYGAPLPPHSSIFLIFLIFFLLYCDYYPMIKD